MAYVRQAEFHALAELIDPVVAVGADQLHHHHGVFHGIDGFYFLSASVIFDPFVLVFGFAGLDMGRITEHDVRKKGRGLGGYDRSSEAVMVKFRQHAGMVDVGMGQKDIVYFRCRNGQGFVLIGISALLHSAVHKNVFASNLKIVAASRHFMICPYKLQLHMAPP